MMKNDLILRRSIHIETWRVQGTMLKAEERGDILMVLQYVADNPSVTAKGLAGALLFEENARLVVAERLLWFAQIYELVEVSEKYSYVSKYALTEKGISALSKKEIFVPEDGIWEISFTDDPLLPHSLIDFKPFKEPAAFQESRKKDELQERKERIKPISKWIQEIDFQSAKPFLNQKQSVWIEKLEKKGEQVSNDLQLVVEWNVSKQNIRLLKGKDVVTQRPYRECEWQDIWQQLLEQNDRQDDWDYAKSSMAIPFEETEDVNRQTMRLNLEFQKPKVDDLGEFDDFTAKDIQIHAGSRQDAVDWADWRLVHSIRNFADRQTYQKWVQQAQAPFAEYDCNLPERDELAKRFWQNEQGSPTAWYLISASDWQI